MRKTFYLLVILALALTSVSLNKPVQAQGNDPQYAGLDMDLTGVTIRMANIGGLQYEPMYKTISVFEEKTHAKVQIVALYDGFDIDKKIKTDYATGAADYDVAWNHTSFMSQYVDYVEDLNQFFTPDELKAFSPAIIKSATIDGKLQLIPRHADVSALFYRQDLYSDPKIQAAYEKETGSKLAVPTTLEDVDKQARFFVKNGYSKYGYGIAGKEEALTGRFYELLFASGGQFLTDKMEPGFNGPEGVKVAKLLRGWYQDGIIAKDTPNLVWDGIFQNFCNGDVAMQLDWYGYYGLYTDKTKCPKIADTFSLTRGFIGFAGPNSRHTGWAGAHAFSIPKSAKNKKAGAQLIKFLSSERVAYEEATRGVLPVRDDVWKRIIADAAKSTDPRDSLKLQIAQTQISEDFKTPPLTAEWIPISNILFPQVQKIMLGDVSAEDGLNAAAKDARDDLVKAGILK